jgi:hypothetical protein
MLPRIPTNICQDIKIPNITLWDSSAERYSLECGILRTGHYVNLSLLLFFENSFCTPEKIGQAGGKKLFRDPAYLFTMTSLPLHPLSPQSRARSLPHSEFCSPGARAMHIQSTHFPLLPSPSYSLPSPPISFLLTSLSSHLLLTHFPLLPSPSYSLPSPPISFLLTSLSSHYLHTHFPLLHLLLTYFSLSPSPFLLTSLSSHRHFTHFTSLLPPSF